MKTIQQHFSYEFLYSIYRNWIWKHVVIYLRFEKTTFTNNVRHLGHTARPKMTTPKRESEKFTYNIHSRYNYFSFTFKVHLTFTKIKSILRQQKITNFKNSYLYNNCVYKDCTQYLIIYKNILLRISVGRSIESVRNLITFSELFVSIR